MYVDLNRSMVVRFYRTCVIKFIRNYLFERVAIHVTISSAKRDPGKSSYPFFPLVPFYTFFFFLTFISRLRMFKDEIFKV